RSQARARRARRSGGAEGRDCESRPRAVRTRGGRRAAPRGRLRPGDVEAGARREHLAGRAVRTIRQRRRRRRRTVARAGAGAEEQRPLCRDPGGVLSSDRTGGSGRRGVTPESGRGAVRRVPEAAGQHPHAAGVRLRRPATLTLRRSTTAVYGGTGNSRRGSVVANSARHRTAGFAGRRAAAKRRRATGTVVALTSVSPCLCGSSVNSPAWTGPRSG